MHEKLVTCSYLQGIGVQVDHTCCLCNREDETLDHLFFECEWLKRYGGRSLDGVAFRDKLLNGVGRRRD